MINTSPIISNVSQNFFFFRTFQSCFFNIAFSYTYELDKSCVVLPVAKDYIFINFTKGTNIKSVSFNVSTATEISAIY